MSDETPVYVLLEEPYSDGSGKASVIGVYQTMALALAARGALFTDYGTYDGQPVVIVEVPLENEVGYPPKA